MILRKRILWADILAASLLVLIPITAGFAQESETNSAAVSPSSDTSAEARTPDETILSTHQPSKPPGGNRVFGVLPNYRTVNESDVTAPLTDRQKFSIASKDSFDYPLVLLAAGLAGIGQWSNQHPSFGQGAAGFGKRVVTAYGDQALGNMMTEGLFPVVLHEDPRYYRRGTGSTWSRTGYALSRIFVTHADSGGVRFNYSEWAGNAAATAISNAYYPDGRTAGANVAKLIEQCGIDGLSQVLKEFWPDIRHKFFERSQAASKGH
jgi:hypothetical protein